MRLSLSREAPINALYGPAMFRLAAGGGVAADIAAPYTAWMGGIKRLIDDLGDKKNIPGIYESLQGQRLAAYVHERTQQAVEKGLGKPFSVRDYNDPDEGMHAILRTNLFRFSQAKTYDQLRRTSDLLVDAKGRITDQGTFVREAQRLLLLENTQSTLLRFRTEYATALSQAASIRRWQAAEEVRDIFPFLQFRTMQDERVRHSHQALHGVTHPINDSYWDSHTPPLGWNCRCRLVPVLTQPSEESSRRPDVHVDEGFEGNPAKTGILFPRNHPYFEQSSVARKRILARSDAFGLAEHIKANRTLYDAFERQGYTKGAFDEASGGWMAIHDSPDLNDSLGVVAAHRLVARGERIVLLPKNTHSHIKSPDVEINGAVFDIKSQEGSNVDRFLKNNFTDGMVQARNLVFQIAANTSAKEVKARFKNWKSNGEWSTMIFLSPHGIAVISKWDALTGNLGSLDQLDQ